MQLTSIGTAARSVNAGLDELRDGIMARIAEAEMSYVAVARPDRWPASSPGRPTGRYLRRPGARRHGGEGCAQLVAADDAAELGLEPAVAVDDEDPGWFLDAIGLGHVGEDRRTIGRIQSKHAVLVGRHVPRLCVDDDQARVVDEDIMEDAERTTARRIGPIGIRVEHEDRGLALPEGLVEGPRVEGVKGSGSELMPCSMLRVSRIVSVAPAGTAEPSAGVPSSGQTSSTVLP